ncbi:MAG: hypothetical protein Kow00122_02540 [Thermoleophilia bacterium]
MAARSVGPVWSVRVMAAMMLLALLGLALAGSEARAADTSLTPEQEALARRIDGKLIAPCCWTQTVAVHQSQAADQIRMQVRLLVAQGKSEKVILDSFVEQYGEKILAAPRARGLNWLAYILPFAALAAGAGALMLMIPRWRRPEPVPVTIDEPVRPRGDSTPDRLRGRLEDELSRFDI